MRPKIFKTKATQKQKLADNTYLLRVEIGKDLEFEFEPGQFVNLLVAPMIRRSYSIASSPSEEGYIDLVADTVMQGPGSKFFENVKEGDEIEVLGPLGQFVYKPSERPAYFFSTGTGVVPFISMIKYALETEKTKREIKLFQGFRYAHDVFGQDVLDELDARFDNFEYILTLSKPDQSWQGKRGRITDHYAEQIQGMDFDAYICGSSTMIADVENRLLDAGIDKDKIYYEQFY